MEDNVSKKTFLSKFSNSVFFLETLSLKKLLQQELLAAISRSQSFKIEVKNCKQLDVYLSKKLFYVLSQIQASKLDIAVRSPFIYPT